MRTRRRHLDVASRLEENGSTRGPAPPSQDVRVRRRPPGAHDPWLADQPTPEECSIGTEPVAELPELEAACDRLGLTLPAVFLDFLRSPQLQSKIHSCTACFVDVGPEPVKAPGADGYLIRFLADQQGCVYWYLYVTATDHAVVSSVDFYGDPEDGDDEGDDEGEIEFCGESIEAFLYRFWLENEIWFAADEGDPLPNDAEEYIRRYQANTTTGSR